VWPLLDLRDFVLRRRHDKPAMYAVHHVPRRVRLRWALLDFYDRVRGALARGLRPAALALLLLAVMGGVAYAALSGSGANEGQPPAEGAPARAAANAPSPPRIEVAGVVDSSEARAERRAERRAAKRRAAKRRALRERRADRRRAAAHRRAAARKRAKKRARAHSAPTPAATPSNPAPPAPVSSPPGSSGGGGSSQNSAPAPTRPPSSGGGGGGGGGGSSPPRQPQSNPGVEFDDQG
jgi:hypothetical protein